MLELTTQLVLKQVPMLQLMPKFKPIIELPHQLKFKLALAAQVESEPLQQLELLIMQLRQLIMQLQVLIEWLQLLQPVK